MTGYLQANIKSQIGAAELTGNVGVQAIWTDQNSSGGSAAPNLDPVTGEQILNPNGSPSYFYATRRSSTDYLDVLPSLNLSLRFPSDFVVRFAAAREIIRPRLDDMRASLEYGYTFTDGVAVVTGSSGNPDLRPWRSMP